MNEIADSYVSKAPNRTREQVTSIDVAKGLAILLVVFGHLAGRSRPKVMGGMISRLCDDLPSSYAAFSF